MDAPVKLSGATKPFIMDGDQHIYEPPDMWTARMPARFKDQAPHVVDYPLGGQAWVFEGGRWSRTIGLEVGAGVRGPITGAIQELFFNIVSGKAADKWNWLTPVPLAEPVLA